MTLALHPDAAKNFDQKAEALVTKLISDPHARQPRPESSFTPGIVIHELPDVEVIDTGYSDYFGNEIAKTFRHGDRSLGLFEDDYKDLVRLAEAMQKSKALQDKVSMKLLVDTIFKWVRERHEQVATQPMTKYVLPECEKRLKEIEIWLPVAMLQLQSPLVMGKVTLKTVTKEMLDVWFDYIRKHAAGFTTDPEPRFKEWRTELQGYAAATIKVFADPHMAAEIAVREAERSLAMLWFFSPANRTPEMISYCTLLGEYHLDGLIQITVEKGRITGYSDHMINKSSPSWTIDDQTIADYEEAHLLSILSDLLSKDDPTEYQEALIGALSQYSRCALAKDPEDKLIAILVALESMLLKDANESIQQNLAERMAFMSDTSANERRATKSVVLKVYGLRSSFIHHGQRVGIDGMDVLREFMIKTWLTFYALIRTSGHYTTRVQMFDHLEEMKMS